MFRAGETAGYNPYMSEAIERRLFRKRRLVGIMVVVSAVVVCAVWYFTGFNFGYRFPSPGAIASMNAFLQGPESGKFVVPSEYYGPILSQLTPSMKDPAPAKWVMLGSLEIATKDGRSIDVGLYDLGESRCAFSAGPTWESRVYYMVIAGHSDRLKVVMEDAMDAAEAK